MHKLYFNTTCWIRTIEDPEKEFQKKEKQAILDIFDLVEKKPNEFAIISSKTQLNQLYTKRNSANTSAQMKNALEFVIAQVELKTSISTQTDPFQANQVRDSLITKTNLPDKEDAKQISIAWIREANYFITTDWNSILNLNEHRMIENAIGSLIHPITSRAGNTIQIIDPISFLNEIKKI